MEQMRTYSGGGLTRIESVDDKNVNRALFTLYSHLVQPLDELEKISLAIGSTRQRIQYLESGVSLNLMAVFSVAWKFMVGVVVLIWISGIFIDHYPGPLSFIDDLGILEGFLLFFVIGAVIGFAIEATKTSATKISMKTELAERRRQENELTQRRNEIIESIKDVICYVPPKYRFATAMQYFVESYQNSRIDNLKEAVNAFDTYYFRESSLKMQKEILEKQEVMEAMLHQIQFNQLQMMGQLEGIRSDIWLSGFLYS